MLYLACSSSYFDLQYSAAFALSESLLALPAGRRRARLGFSLLFAYPAMFFRHSATFATQSSSFNSYWGLRSRSRSNASFAHCLPRIGRSVDAKKLTMAFSSWTSSVRAGVFFAGQLPFFGFFLLIAECCSCPDGFVAGGACYASAERFSGPFSTFFAIVSSLFLRKTPPLLL